MTGDHRGHPLTGPIRVPPLFPGGVAVSDLCVYDWEGADGLPGGSPHLHTASSEGYVVIGGEGEVHTLSREGAAIHPLAPGEVVYFSPGTVHRLVNRDDLRLVVVMQNAGLPEAGDAVLTFPADILDDPGAYASAAALPDGDPDLRASAARRRRDLALEGYGQLRAAIRDRGPEAYAAFQARAARIVQPKVAQWRATWERTVEAETARTRDQLAQLAQGEPGLMADAAVVRADPTPGARGFGMCGRLQTWRWPAG